MSRYILVFFLFQVGFARAQESEAPATDAAVSTPPAEAPPGQLSGEAALPPEAKVPAAQAAPNAPADTGGDYEIDYEEEPDAGPETAGGVEEPTPTPTPVAKSPKKPAKRSVVAKPTPVPDRNAPTSLGTRSKNRFAPQLKKDTKSVYKKNGKFLDVDTD